jgi:hypothetical protein
MAIWAYECRPCSGANDRWLVACERVDTFAADVSILRVKTGSGWACAVVDRSRPVEVDAMLLRDAVPSEADDCPDCVAAVAAVAPQATAIEAHPVPEGRAATQLTAAAIALQGRQMLVVLVGLDVVQSPGEADKLIADLRARFGGVDVVLMGQHEDGRPQYHGEATLLPGLAGVPIDRMPWKSYPVR